MGQINWSRVVLGGLVAGLLMNASEFIMGVVLGTQSACDVVVNGSSATLLMKTKN